MKDHYTNESGRNVLISATVLLLCGCSTLPHFEDTVYGEQKVSPTVNDMTHEIQCEILAALKKGVRFINEDQAQQRNDPEGKRFADLASSQYGWVASVNLTLDVTDNEGLNPSLSYINPLKAANTNFTSTLDAQFSEEQHRNINVVFALLIDSGTPTDGACDPSSKPGLQGNLGIGEIVATGLPYAAAVTSSPYIMKAIGIALPSAPSSAPLFGSTVDFTIVYGLGGTPTWTLTHFAGPGPSSGDLLTAMRTHKDTLVLSFAQATGSDVNAVGAAAKAAQDNVTRMILQRILP